MGHSITPKHTLGWSNIAPIFKSQALHMLKEEKTRDKTTITLSYQGMKNKWKSNETWVCCGSEIASSDRLRVGIDTAVHHQPSFYRRPPPSFSHRLHLVLSRLPSLEEE